MQLLSFDSRDKVLWGKFFQRIAIMQKTSVRSYNLDEIITLIRSLLADAQGVDVEEVVMGARLVGDLGVESLDSLDIKLRLEQTFEVELDRDSWPLADPRSVKVEESRTEKYKQAVTVRDIVDYMHKLLKSKHRAV